MRLLGVEYRKLTADQKSAYKPAGPSNEDYLERRKHIMYAHRHGMPRKPPPSGLNVYIREKLSDLKGQSLSKTAVKFAETVKDWKALPPDVHASYSKKAQDLKACYEKDLELWAAEHDIQFTKNIPLLASRLYDRMLKRSAETPQESAQFTITSPSKELNHKAES
ncbi:unnamed protein product [Dicrocoelium dendriticum]|nr:unnamed protein product [Dicrocoelium dendriticum]